MEERKRNTYRMILVCLFMAFFSCAIATSFREVEFTAEQKKHIDAFLKVQKQVEDEISALDEWLYRNTGSVVPSAAYILFNDGECLYRNVVRGAVDRLFDMASITKTFIALAILQLAERGVISLDDPVSMYLPVHLENSALNSPPITILHLLTHTSGLADGGGYIDKRIHPTLPIPEQKYPAGLRFNYSNQGYNVLGFLIPAVTGMPLHEYVRKNIFGPLEMNGSVAKEDMAGSAGIKCTIEDLGNYLTMLFNRGKFKGKRIISENSFNLIFRETYEEPPAENKEYRGITFRVWTMGGSIVSFHHAAHMNGAGGFMQLFPRSRAGYLFISNPPVYETADYYKFYNSMKGKLLKISSLLTKDDFNPLDFQISLPNTEEMHAFTGKYTSVFDDSFVEISFTGGDYLIAMKSSNRTDYFIQPTSKHSFVYIYPGQSEKGEIFDFIWDKGSFKALCDKEGYYLHETPAGK